MRRKQREVREWKEIQIEPGISLQRERFRFGVEISGFPEFFFFLVLALSRIKIEGGTAGTAAGCPACFAAAAAAAAACCSSPPSIQTTRSEATSLLLAPPRRFPPKSFALSLGTRVDGDLTRHTLEVSPLVRIKKKKTSLTLKKRTNPFVSIFQFRQRNIDKTHHAFQTDKQEIRTVLPWYVHVR